MTGPQGMGVLRPNLPYVPPFLIDDDFEIDTIASGAWVEDVTDVIWHSAAEAFFPSGWLPILEGNVEFQGGPAFMHHTVTFPNDSFVEISFTNSQNSGIRPIFGCLYNTAGGVYVFHLNGNGSTSIFKATSTWPTITGTTTLDSDGGGSEAGIMRIEREGSDLRLLTGGGAGTLRCSAVDSDYAPNRFGLYGYNAVVIRDVYAEAL